MQIKTIQPFNSSTIQRVKAAAFTLAETLIVIGIIGVVAALTLPNLNHATGDKETVTRLQKIYSSLSDANDRAVATYGPISEWSEECRQELDVCWRDRIGEFLKISNGSLPDGTTINVYGHYVNCNGVGGFTNSIKDVCVDEFFVDINGPKKGKNLPNYDVFRFMVSDKNGVMPYLLESNYDYEDYVNLCLSTEKSSSDVYDGYCTFWVIDHGNLDYLKADEDGNCNDSNIVLDGVTNTSCH